MVNGLFRALIATFLASLVLVLTVPKHYVHACEHDHAQQSPLSGDQQEPVALIDHQCAICDLTIPSYTPEHPNCLDLVTPWVTRLLVISPRDAVMHRSDRSADRGPPAMS